MVEPIKKSIKSYWEYNLLRWEKSRYHALTWLNPASWAIRKRLRCAAELILKNSSEFTVWADLGCGSGVLWSALKDHNLIYIGYDYSKDGIDEAQKKYQLDKRARFVHLDIVENDIAAADGFVMLGLVDWLSREDLLKVIRSLNGHHLIISFTESNAKRMYFFYKFYHRVFRKSSPTNDYPKGYEINDFIELVESSGFSLKFIRSHGLGPGRLAYFTKKTNF